MTFEKIWPLFKQGQTIYQSGAPDWSYNINSEHGLDECQWCFSVFTLEQMLGDDWEILDEST